MLLPLTNLSALTTAALLDANRGLSSGQARALVQLHQDLYCSLRVPDPPGTVRATFSNVSLLLYQGNDIVSDHLAGKARTWETAETNEMLAAMRTPVPASPAELRSPKDWRRPASPFVIDVGANIGWFSLNAAAAGGTVAAFEAMASNIALLRASLCGAPWLMSRTALYGTGLGTSRSDCHILSGKINRGDGHVLCDQDPEQAAKQWKVSTGFEYESRGRISLMRLDSLVTHDVQVMKIDVEGYEPQVLSGAEGLFAAHNVWFLMTECNPSMVNETGQVAFIKRLDGLGYAVSTRSFKGPFLTDSEVRSGRPPSFAGGGMTLYCVKKTIRDAAVASLAQGRRGLLRAAGAAPGGSSGAGAGAGTAADASWAAWFDAASGF